MFSFHFNLGMYFSYFNNKKVKKKNSSKIFY